MSKQIEKSTIELVVTHDENNFLLNKGMTFNVPKDVTSISIKVNIDQPMWFSYMVYDGQKELRAQFLKGNAPQPVVIHTERGKTSPYTISGPILTGEWTLDVSIEKNEGRVYRSDLCTCIISFNEETNNVSDALSWQDPQSASFYLKNFQANKVFNESKKWYKGDFHTHCIYSDGKMTREENMVSAANQKLDFYVATDHNVLPTSWFDGSDILVIPGVEVSALLGHCNLISVNKSPYCNQRLRDMYTEEGMNRILKDDYGHSIVSINHPFLTEWKWKFTETPLEFIDTLEICNDPTYSYNENATEWALIAWNHLLNDGYQITGIGGSDSHMKPTETYEDSKEPSLIGDPGTFVYCDGLSANQVVNGLKKGNVTVSRGERIQFQIDDLISGDYCGLVEGMAKASVSTDEAIYFEWVVDGEVVTREKGNTSEYTFRYQDDTYHWIRVDVRYEDGRFYGFANPIFFGRKEPSLTKWGQVLDLMKEIVND
ncbi:CehA/McbA family metallohydrolase [Neobacillus vireti]|uniref:CehA/McbA family metallohydrolase n=1 Tax=Neobacillus vireti TaxID=220686 RepID=UPI002FFF8504